MQRARRQLDELWQRGADFLGAPGQEDGSRLMTHLKGIGAFLVAENRIPALPADWSRLFNTRPIQGFLRGA